MSASCANLCRQNSSRNMTTTRELLWRNGLLLRDVAACKQDIEIHQLCQLATHSLAAASRPRLSETEPKWFMFETSCYAYGGRIRRFAKLNVNKVKIFTVSYLFKLQVVPFDIYTFLIVTIR